jgi:hypothetical protein
MMHRRLINIFWRGELQQSIVVHDRYAPPPAIFRHFGVKYTVSCITHW